MSLQPQESRLLKLRELANDPTVIVVWSQDDLIFRVDAEVDGVYGSGFTEIEAIEDAIRWLLR